MQDSTWGRVFPRTATIASHRTSFLSRMCEPCDSDPSLLSKAVTDRLDLSPLSKPQRASTKVGDALAKLLHNVTILMMAIGNFSKVEALPHRQPAVLSLSGAQRGGYLPVAWQMSQRARSERFLLIPHVHLFATSLVDYFFSIEMAPAIVSTKDKAVELMEHAATRSKGAGNGDWAVRYGYDPSRGEGHLELLKGNLDAVTSDAGVDVPAFIVNRSGHLAYLRSMALEYYILVLSFGFFFSFQERLYMAINTYSENRATIIHMLSK